MIESGGTEGGGAARDDGRGGEGRGEGEGEARGKGKQSSGTEGARGGTNKLIEVHRITATFSILGRLLLEQMAKDSGDDGPTARQASQRPCGNYFTNKSQHQSRLLKLRIVNTLKVFGNIIIVLLKANNFIFKIFHRPELHKYKNIWYK